MKSKALFERLVAYNTVPELEELRNEVEVQIDNVDRKRFFNKDLKGRVKLTNEIRHLTHRKKIINQAIYFLECKLTKSRVEQWTGISPKWYGPRRIEDYIQEQFQLQGLKSQASF